MDSVSTYSEARNEYLKQLSTWIVPYMIQHYRGVWAEAFKVGGQQRVMVVFQETCAQVPKWNQDVIDSNISKLLDNCRCDYLEELMAAVFIAHTKVLIAIRVSSKHKKLQITLPKLDHFLHRVFSECARSFWKTPYLFLDDAKPIEMQKNLLQAEALCSESIATAVRSMLPIKSILNEYLSDDVMAAEPVIEEGPVVPSVPEEQSQPVFSGGAIEESETKAVAITSSLPITMNSVPVTAPVQESQSESQAQEQQEEQTQEQSQEQEQSEQSEQSEQTQEQEQEEQSQSQSQSQSQVQEDALEPPKSILKPASQEEEVIAIDTERSVHFGDYDNVFPAGEPASFDYNPKSSDEPEMRIMDEAPLSMDSMVTNLEPSGASDTMVLSADEVLE
jgi:hypothetical protein